MKRAGVKLARAKRWQAREAETTAVRRAAVWVEHARALERTDLKRRLFERYRSWRPVRLTAHERAEAEARRIPGREAVRVDGDTPKESNA